MFLAFVLISSPAGKVTALSTVWHTLYLCYRTLFSTEGELIYFLAVGYSMPPSFISPCLSLFSSFGEVKNTVSGLVRFMSLIINVLMCFYGESIKVGPGPSGPKDNTYLLDNKHIM